MKTICCSLFILICGACGVTYAADLDFDATIRLSPRFELSLPVSGVVKTVKVTAGQRVSKGDELLALDPVPFDAARTYAQSRVTVQQTLLVESLRDLKQQQELFDRTVLASVELENAQLRVKRDQALLANAQAQLAEADYALSYSRLTAPFDAMILSVQANPGMSINNALQSRTLVTLARQGQYQASFSVPADMLANISSGQLVRVKAGEELHQGIISSISYEPLPAKGGESSRYMIQADFTSENKSMPIGVRAKVHFE